MTLLRSIGLGLSLSVPFVVAIVVRLVGVSEVFRGHRTRLLDPDSHMHAWRMITVLQGFPALPPPVEPMIAYPRGGLLAWPPGLDYLGGALAWLCGLSPDGQQVARLGTLLSVLLAAGCVLAVVLLTRRYTSVGWAVVSGLLLALWPIHSELNRVGRIDLHGLEPLIGSLAVLLFLRRSRSGYITAGAALGGAVWFVPGAIQLLAVLGVGIVVLGIVHRDTSAGAVLTFATALAAAAPLCLATPFRESLSVNSPSALQLLLLLSLLLAASWVWAAPRLLKRAHAGADRTMSARPFQLLGVLACLTLFAVFVPWGEVLRGPRLGDTTIAQTTLLQLRPAHIISLLTYLVLALPVLVGLALGSEDLAPARRSEVVLLACWSGIFILLGTLRLQTIPLAAALAVPLCGLALARVAGYLRRRLERRARRGLLVALAPAVGVGALCLHWPGVDHFLNPTSRDRALLRSVAVEEAVGRIRRRSTPTQPAVMTSVEAGNTLLHLARVPIVGSTSSSGQDSANADSLTFQVIPDRAIARGLLHRHRAGWVLAAPMPFARFAKFLRILNRPDNWLHIKHFHRRSTAVRLSFDLGSAGELDGTFLPAIPWLQHDWESTPRPDAPSVHLFRVVKGAQLEGRGPVRAMVHLSLPLVTARGRPFTYQDWRRSDRLGQFQFRVPYWTADAVPVEVARYLQRLKRLKEALARGARGLKPLKPLNRPTFTPLGALTVEAAGMRQMVEISRRAVLEGRTIRFTVP